MPIDEQDNYGNNEINASEISESRYKSISNEKRRDLIRIVSEEGGSIKEIASFLQIKYASARKIMSNFKKNGKIEKMPKGGSLRNVNVDFIRQKIEYIVSLHPGLTLKEIKKAMEDDQDISRPISKSSIDRCLRDLKITMKLSHREIDRVNLPEKIILRKEFALWFNDFFNSDFSTAIFIDETSFNLHIKRSKARSKKGTRALINVPAVRGRSVSLIGSMTINGMGYCKTISHSTVNGNIFLEYIKELCHYSRDVLHMRNACLILDNARIHRKNDMETITQEFGYSFKFLSPYSYMLNPIENAFSKIKNCVRSRLRMGFEGDLSSLILQSVGNVTIRDCVGYFSYVQCNIINCAAERPYIHR